MFQKFKLYCFQDTSSLRIIDSLRNTVGSWLKDHHIKGFYSVTSEDTFAKGAMSIMNLAGVGKLLLLVYCWQIIATCFSFSI